MNPSKIRQIRVRTKLAPFYAISGCPDKFCEHCTKLGDNPDTTREIASGHDPLNRDQGVCLIDRGPPA